MLVLEHLFHCERPERALAVLESALHERHLRPADVHRLAARVPRHLRPLVLGADGREESGIETIVRFHLERLGMRVAVQQEITGVGTVDLVVDGRLIIEGDGREWHDDDDAFERDRMHDLGAATGRWRTLRATRFQVLLKWPKVESAVLAAVR